MAPSTIAGVTGDRLILHLRKPEESGKRAPTEAAAYTNRTEVASGAVAAAPSQRFQVAFHKLHDEFVVAGMTPAIAVDAADQHLTVMVDFH